MSLSRSTVNVRQLRGSKPVDGSASARTESLSDATRTAMLHTAPARDTATLGSLKSHSPPRPVVAWEDSATLPATKQRRSSDTKKSRVPQWPPPDFVKRELPGLGTTQIMAVRINRSGAPLGAPKAAAAGGAGLPSVTQAAPRKPKTRGVTLGGWRTGVTAVKFASNVPALTCSTAHCGL